MRMQKMPLPVNGGRKLPAPGGPKKPAPVRPGPKQRKGGGVLDQLKKLGPTPRNNKRVPGSMDQLKKGYSSALKQNKLKQAYGNVLNKQKNYKTVAGTNKGGGVMPNFKGVMAPRKQPITRPVAPRRGR